MILSLFAHGSSSHNMDGISLNPKMPRAIRLLVSKQFCYG